MTDLEAETDDGHEVHVKMPMGRVLWVLIGFVVLDIGSHAGLYWKIDEARDMAASARYQAREARLSADTANKLSDPLVELTAAVKGLTEAVAWLKEEGRRHDEEMRAIRRDRSGKRTPLLPAESPPLGQRIGTSLLAAWGLS